MASTTAGPVEEAWPNMERRWIMLTKEGNRLEGRIEEGNRAGG